MPASVIALKVKVYILFYLETIRINLGDDLAFLPYLSS